MNYNKFENQVATAVSDFGASVRPKLRAAKDHREDQLRGPLEVFLHQIGMSLSLEVVPVGEQELPNRSRPDYLIRAAGAAIGHIELKAPGHGVDPTRWSDKSHDRKQWERIKPLPNLLYSDGRQWALYHNGNLSGEIITLLGGDLEEAGSSLAPPNAALARMLHEFLSWKPAVPRTLRQLVAAISGLCALLRADVSDRLRQESSGKANEWFTHLASDWRRLLFPGATDQAFADQYAQTVTFALLLARVEGITFDNLPLADIAQQLGKKHSLMGRALSLLTEDIMSELGYLLESMLRVIGVVDWSKLDDGTGDSYLQLYEHFLELYDPKLRKETGSYYTPREVTSFMTGFTEEILRRRLKIPEGFASNQVHIVDPAMGTGTFLLNVIDRVATTAAQDGPGAVPEQLRALIGRLIGFEKQTGPYAVAELRTYQALMHKYGTEPPTGGLRYYVADTLDDPYQEPESLGRTYEPIARSLRAASKVKRDEQVMVVLGNPPYRERAKQFGKWITSGTRKSVIPHPLPGFSQVDNDEISVQIDTPPLEAFVPADIRSSSGAHLKHLHNLYVYFWRWATWKVFDAHPEAPTGIVTFITTSGYLTGPGFVGMREYLRKTADEGWIIDLSPEGHQPEVRTRIFPSVQHPLCIGVFVRKNSTTSDTTARIWYTSITGTRRDKFEQLTNLDPDDSNWTECSTGWGEPFRPPSDPIWASFPEPTDLMPWSSPGVKANRTWVRSPCEDVLRDRWQRLIRADLAEQPKLFKESRDANLESTPEGIFEPRKRLLPFKDNPGKRPVVTKYGFRSFDVQYIIADPRVLNDPRPDLWRADGPRQLYMTELHSQPIAGGPGITFTAYVPDMHHYKGSGGGRTFPLYDDPESETANVNKKVLAYLANRLNAHISAEDFIAYLAAVVAHPSYTARFAKSLRTPGVRVPLTTSSELWNEAVSLGREVIWLHTKGERFFDPEAGRPAQPPRMQEGLRPKIEHPIAQFPGDMPETITYEAATQTLHVGAGQIRPVPAEVWAYNVGGMGVVRKWFSYRKRNPAGKRSSDLDAVNSEIWLPSFDSGLIDLLNVLGRLVAIEPAQDDLLARICAMATVSKDTLASVGALPTASRMTRGSRRVRHDPDQDELDLEADPGRFEVVPPSASGAV